VTLHRLYLKWIGKLLGEQKSEIKWEDNNVETFMKISNLHFASKFSRADDDDGALSNTAAKMTSVYLASMVSYTIS
jgi:hypothetical protein